MLLKSASKVSGASLKPIESRRTKSLKNSSSVKDSMGVLMMTIALSAQIFPSPLRRSCFATRNYVSIHRRVSNVPARSMPPPIDAWEYSPSVRCALPVGRTRSCPQRRRLMEIFQSAFKRAFESQWRTPNENLIFYRRKRERYFFFSTYVV